MKKARKTSADGAAPKKIKSRMASGEKSEQSKPKRGRTKGESATTTAGAEPPTISPAAAVARDIASVIERIDISSLSDADVAMILSHCNAALEFRKVEAVSTEVTTLSTRSIGRFCYTKSGSSSTVSVWRDGFKVGETSEDDAASRGIRPCG